MRGRLPFPVTGRVEISEVDSPGGGGRGLLVTATPQAMVRAIYAGRVAFADTYGDYGQSVILDHGGGYFTVSAGLASVSVRVGDDLESGAILGRCGRGLPALQRSAPGAASMYFELRQGAQVVSPGPWFGL